MTCEEFERNVTDLACEFLIEAASRKRALAHAQACLRCAARLQQERALTAVMNETASAEIAQAPARTRAALLAAFGQQTAAAEVAPLVSANRLLPRRSRGVMAAAAAVMLAAILVVLQLLHQQSKVESSVNAEPAVAGASSPPDSSSPPGGVNGQSSSESRGVKAESQKPSAVDRENQIPPPRTTRRRMRAIFSPVLARTNQPAPSETVSDFIPLTAIADSTAMRSGTVVRVEMPRASLIAMGLPLHVERANETVKADIVVGDDGLARAIRLVY